MGAGCGGKSADCSHAKGYLNGSGDDPQGGYVGPVLASLRTDHPKTKLVNLACSGETTSTLINGGRCDYEEGSQLDQAVEFLHAHRRYTRLVTIDIGGNDIATCGFQGLPPTCVAADVDADVADVETAFSTLAFEPTVPLPGHGDVPLNVARICQWTTMCTKLDFHANPAGYGVMATAVEAVLD